MKTTPEKLKQPQRQNKLQMFFSLLVNVVHSSIYQWHSATLTPLAEHHFACRELICHFRYHQVPDSFSFDSLMLIH